MAAEIVRLVWCDICLAGDDPHKVPAKDETVIAVGNASTVLALCEPHAIEILAPLTSVLHLGDTKHDALAGLRAKPAKAPATAPPAEPRLPRGRAANRPATGTWECPVDGCDYTGGTRDALGSHVYASHDRASLPVLLGVDWGRTQPLPCDLCDELPKGPAALFNHLVRQHGMDKSDATREYRDDVIRKAKRAEAEGQLALPGGP